MGKPCSPEYHREYHRRWRANPENRRRELDAQNERRRRERREGGERAEKVRKRDRDVYHNRPANWLRRFRLRKYKITPQEWDAMFVAQGSRCAICQSDHPRTKMTWHTDHDHATKKVRGILCGDCNRMIGAARDNPDCLREGAKYLEERFCAPT